jgi:hypothetical protein
VVDYIEEHLDGGLTLGQMAAVLQAPGRRHAGAVPDVRKNRLTGRKTRQETPK